MSYDISKVLNVAEQEVGYLEKLDSKKLDSKTENAGSGNWTKYWRDLAPSMQGQPWCDGFVSWCFLKAYGQEVANKLLCGGLHSYYTPASAKKYEDKKRFSSVPAIGDQIFFRNNTRICHTGIVVGVTATTVITIEGNTSGASGVIPNGGGVKKKSYSRNYSGIAGYGHPEYSTEASKFPKWVKSGGEWYYRIKDGVNAHGWMDINHHRYYFDESGKMLKDNQNPVRASHLRARCTSQTQMAFSQF